MNEKDLLGCSFPGNVVEDDDWNLLYMAVTRAQTNLFMNGTIKNILARAGVSQCALSITIAFAVYIYLFSINLALVKINLTILALSSCQGSHCQYDFGTIFIMTLQYTVDSWKALLLL